MILVPWGLIVVFRRVLIGLWLIAASTPMSLAQSATGNLHVQVTDPSGASVANATVIVTTPSGEANQGTTNKDGICDFKSLAPGAYSLKAIATGFTPFAKDKFEITSGKISTVNVVLSIEIQEQKVEVTDSPSRLDLNPSSNAGAITITGKDLEALSDDPDELQAELQALAGPSSGPNGGQIYIDGFTGGQLPPKASIREIRVNQNPFSAEYDRLGYGRIEIFTKPGTDQLHGQLYISGTTAALNARNPFEHFAPGVQPPGYDSVQYSGEVGGPLSKKASLDFNIERRDINDLSVVSARILDPVTLAIIPYSATVANPRGRTNLSPRLDYQTSANNTLTLRYQYERENETGNGVGQFNLPSQAFNALNSEHQLQLSDTLTINPKTINETRARFSREINTQSPLSSDPTLNVQGAFNGGGSSGGRNSDKQNRFEIQNNTYMSFGKHSPKFGGRLRFTQDINSSNSNFNGNFTFGSRIDPACPTINTSPQSCAQISGLTAYQITQQYLATPGDPQANLLLAISKGGGASAFSITTGTAAVKVNYFDVGIFAQDDWRVRPNLTISYGLRYESQNNIGDHANIAPRIGLAWGIGSDGNKPPKTVLRLGYGIFYDRFGYPLILQQERLNGVLQQQLRFTNPKFYFDKNPPPALPPGALSAGTVYQGNSNLRAPYTLQAGVSLERQLSTSTNLTVTYLNARGVHQFYTDNINALECTSFPCDPNTTPRPLPSPNNIFQYQSAGTFKQNQLIVNSNVRLGAKLSLSGYYTMNYASGDTSGSGSFPSTPGRVAADYGRTAFDVRHRAFLSGTMSLPYSFRVSPFFIATSGSPFNIITGQDLYSDGIYNARPVFATCPSQSATVRSTVYGCFDAAPQTGVTLIPVNYAQGDARYSLNVRLSKTFGFGKKKEGAARADAGAPPSGGAFGRGPGGDRRGGGGFGNDRSGGPTNNRYGLTFGVSARNIFNKVNLANPVGDLSSPLFGQANALAGRPYGDSTSNRRLDLQLTFTF
ncbi:MAG TPA: carboxypeptidase regulatory-like domain-containing protein [Candidatus Dormibacteraeota bacterium]|nr:carboxypeptidase regulatory-like domain-containing protein [Candidatus Dormibacteraeota bacterium]